MTGVYEQYFVAIVHKIVVADISGDVSLRPGFYSCGYEFAAATAAQCYARYTYIAIVETVVRNLHTFAGEG